MKLWDKTIYSESFYWSNISPFDPVTQLDLITDFDIITRFKEVSKYICNMCS